MNMNISPQSIPRVSEEAASHTGQSMFPSLNVPNWPKIQFLGIFVKKCSEFCLNSGPSPEKLKQSRNQATWLHSTPSLRSEIWSPELWLETSKV